ncbi:lanthionine synthetase LanC family protein [Chryseobacterium sp. RLHN22]|uniref:lanthionine synthetase LanC family protein n=1 Tax=Chryseobacterium sp. RLHN22 TaxID=3437885 RepID=UPI003D9BE962
MNPKLLNKELNLLDNSLNDIIQCIEMHRNHKALSSPCFDTGLLGTSFFYTLLYDYANDERYLDTAFKFFEQGLYAINGDFHPTYLNDSLDSHIGQIGRYLNFITEHKNFCDYDFSDYLNHLDELLQNLYPSKILKGDFDIVSGALASGVYFLTRDSNIATQALNNIVKGIYNAKKINSKGYYWTVPTLGNRIYLGISHGSAMLINFLCAVYKKGIAKEMCEDLIYNASRYLLNNKRINKYTGLFDNYIGEEPEPKQFSVCYGDIGNGLALLKAGKALKSDLLVNESSAVLNNCLTRNFEDNLTLDASIYYGAAGLYIAFAEVYSLTADVRFLEKADYWLNCIPKYKVHDNDYAGFKTRLLDQVLSWNICFGWGITGIGSVILNNHTKSFKSLTPLTLLT